MPGPQRADPQRVSHSGKPRRAGRREVIELDAIVAQHLGRVPWSAVEVKVTVGRLREAGVRLPDLGAKAIHIQLAWTCDCHGQPTKAARARATLFACSVRAW